MPNLDTYFHRLQIFLPIEIWSPRHFGKSTLCKRGKKLSKVCSKSQKPAVKFWKNNIFRRDTTYFYFRMRMRSRPFGKKPKRGQQVHDLQVLGF